MDTTATNSVEWRQPLNVCRCCLSEACYKDISTEYYYSGQKEVYEDMLKDTFGIQISHHEGGGSTHFSRHICEECIQKLRDACHFKETVLRSEMTFAAYLNGECYNLESKMQQWPLIKEKDPVKLEVVPENDLMIKSDDHDEDFHDDGSLDDDEILANIKLELTKMDKEVKPMKRRKLRPDVKTKKKSKIKRDGIKAKHQNGDSNKDWLKIAERRGNGPILRQNSLKLIAHSTICVFQWNKSRYRCFCCKEPFSDMNLLRDHTEKLHTLENIEKKIIIQQNRLVKVEVSVLFCKLCGLELENLTALKNHLHKHHEIEFELQDDLLVPFKISNGELKCQLCSQTFTVFRLLNIHMNLHYQKQVCHICGAGFSNLVFLNLHKSRSHRPFNCKPCSMTFKTRLDKRDHDVNVHNVKYERKLRFPCPYCSERFSQENFRVQHLVEKHGMVKPEHKCTLCSKVFITKSLCNNHVKNVHMKEKNHECEVCHHLFYTKSDVARHRVTHTGEKSHLCNVCNNLFATKDSLRRHIKRTHGGMA